MSTTISLLHDLPTTAPTPSVGQRGARIAKAIWRGLESIGQVRARRHLLDLAAMHDGVHPELAQRLRLAAKELGNV